MSEVVYRDSVDRPWLDRLPHAPARYAVGVVGLAGLYYAGAKTGYLLEFSGPVAAIVWLPVGVGIAFLYLGGVAYWPGVLIGDLLANNYSVLPLGSALGQTCGNVLEVVLATLLLRRLVRRGSPLDTVGGVGAVAVSIAAATAMSATIGSTSLLSGGVIGFHDLGTVWRTWWLGDATGALVVVPFALAWYAPLPKGWSRARWLEGAGLLLAVVALAYFASRSSTSLTYLIFPVLTWAALRFGQRGATLAVAVTTVFTVWNVTHYVGPFHFTSVTRSVLSTQLFIAVAALTTLSLAAAVAERERFSVRLGASRLRLISASDNARRRLEHDLHDGAQLRLTWLAQRLHDSAGIAQREPDRAVALLEEAGGELQLAIDELRELAHGIHPAVLVDLGLAEALKSLALRSSIPVKLVELPQGRLDSGAEAVGYYVAAEAFANAQKYSGASVIEVRAAAARGVLRIEITDDGVGGAAEQSGSGLEGLRDRAEARGGTIELASPPGGGTHIQVEIPA
ncbi:MAG TPA: MASE1 domain-containing protein [Gaiellaceae bacterium]|nr:MASE1 domain-containing protein [Gaiellaceae bacterium]